MPYSGISGLDRWMSDRIYQDAAVGIEQAGIAFEQGIEIAPSFKTGPGGAVGLCNRRLCYRDDCRNCDRGRSIMVFGNANRRPGPLAAAKSSPAAKVK